MINESFTNLVDTYKINLKTMRRNLCDVGYGVAIFAWKIKPLGLLHGPQCKKYIVGVTNTMIRLRSSMVQMKDCLKKAILQSP